ncbi:hypothetical protein [Azospirillum sp. TSO22-1]|uniref:hypothetical protein n=1 Tax=Azospirillum sp. TSO22-1 TaxID=716789 RepID=UPI000D610813|nr:hypothetical protein [Azospirillum sp. TSO22-1]PWC56181.1 hypothetical protein TSO221_02830 [Azospirillum sp. TSO22-1]
MRAFDGQHSDNVAIKRTREQKERALRELKEQLATLKSHAAPAIREALVKRIAEMEADLKAPPPSRNDRGPRSGGDRPGDRNAERGGFRSPRRG